MVRVAVEGDVPRIIDMIEALVAAVDGPVSPNRYSLRHTLLTMIASPMACVFVTDGGFIAGTLAPTIIGPDRFAHEFGWYASDRSGLALLTAFEAWAKENDARVRLSTGANAPDRLRDMLTRRGYRAAELAWVN